jgi:general secretion pathway protein G
MPAELLGLSCGTRAAERGFSLLELLIVLVIIGGMGAIAAPSLTTLYDRITFSMAREDVERAIGALPRKAQASGRSIMLPATPDKQSDKPQDAPTLPTMALAQITLPKGWSLVVEKPIVFRFDGLCLGGKVTIKTEHVSSNYLLEAPFCRPKEIL